MSETRRTFTREYKLSAVKLVTEQGRSFSEAARRLAGHDGKSPQRRKAEAPTQALATA